MNPGRGIPIWDVAALRRRSSGLPAAISPGVLRFYLTAAVLTGALRGLTILMVGQMPISELVLMAVLFHAVLWFILFQRLPVSVPCAWALRLFCVCQLIAFSSYIASDLWWQSAPTDMLRGWLRMVFVLLDILALALLFGIGDRAFVMFQWGVCLSGLQALVVTPLFGEYWKFGFGYPLTIATLLFAPRFLGYWGALLTCLGLGVLHTLLDFRSLGAICLVLGMLNGLFLLPRTARKRLLAVGGVVILVGAPWIFRLMFTETEGRANRSNVERSAMLQAAWNGFVASPLLGNGSWFSKSKVMDDFLFIRAEKTKETGGGLGFDDNDSEGVAIHSQILAALAEGGILGGLFFMVYAGFLVWALWFCLTGLPWTWLTPTRLFIIITSFWDVWMSAFTGPIRVNIAVTVVMLVSLLDQRRARPTKEVKPARRGRLASPVPA